MDDKRQKQLQREVLVQAIDGLEVEAERCSEPAIACVLAVLAGCIRSGDDAAMAFALAEFAVKKVQALETEYLADPRSIQ